MTPNSNIFGREKNHCSLQLEMESQADIIYTEETLLQFMLRKAKLTTNL
ncbi:MAG TPA: hypothetical protein V6C71_25980 [Coleofasciculaceae cyanobacterium]|jgi:hypothetical protein